MFFLHDVWELFIDGSFKKKSKFVVTNSINHSGVVVSLCTRETAGQEGKLASAITIKCFRSLFCVMLFPIDKQARLGNKGAGEK